MSADNATPAAEAPSAYVTLPGSDVLVIVHRDYQDPAMVRIEYAGWPDELVAAGAMTPEMAVPTGKHRRDPDGGRASIMRYWRLRSDGKPHRYCKITRLRPLHTIGRWPGATEALAAYEEYVTWDKKQRPWAYDEQRIATLFGIVPTSAPRPALRLVVDNTKEAP
ncbi:MAG TPA: hypothetical protein VGG63_16465 [Steroidobacteraceae bacterium]|jgi:hypothetical protein